MADPRPASFCTRSFETSCRIRPSVAMPPPRFPGLTLRVMLLPSAFPGSLAETSQYLTSYLINDTLAIDAGALGIFAGHAEQARVRHVLISHSHADHIAT